MKDVEIVRRLEELSREKGELETKTGERLEEIKKEQTSLRTILNQRSAGLDESKIGTALTVIEVEGGFEREGGCIERAMRCLAAGGESMKRLAISVKDYAHFRGQQCDCEYGYGPKHGHHVFTVGLTREARKRDLTEDEMDAAIYYLVHLKQIQEANSRQPREPNLMYPSIPVSEFIQPERGSSAFNAIQRAIDVKPEVVLIGIHGDEKYFRVQSKGRPPHCVILTQDGQGDRIAKCDCPAHYIPQEPRACLHIAQALIWEAENGSSND